MKPTVRIVTVLAAAQILLAQAAWSAPATQKKVCVEVVLMDTNETPPGETKAEPAAPTPAKVGSPTGQSAAAAEDQNKDKNKEKDEVPSWADEVMKVKPRPEPVKKEDSPKPAAAPENEVGTVLPIGQTPLAYLKRLIEHFVTHETGFEAVREGCEEHLRVELYPLAEGWTVFARYSGTGREERVDQLFQDELSQFAERSVLALLYNTPISATIARDTVLRADSKKSVQRIKGTHHFTIGLGTQLRLGQVDTAVKDTVGSVDQQWRLFTPMTVGLGYRGKFESWGIETLADVGIGTSKTGLRYNDQGGHVDLGGDFGVALHFLGYLNPRGLTSFYLGGGSTFELLWFSAIRPTSDRGGDSRSMLYGGGLDVDLICGFEFMRASSVQFFLQAELQVPAYVVQTDDDYVASIKTWFPGLSVKLGVMF